MPDESEERPAAEAHPLHSKYVELKERLAEIADLERAGRILSWDQHTKMPPKGAGLRAEQLATLTRVTHQRFVAVEVGRLLDALRAYEEALPPESHEASLVRVGRRDWEKARRVPPELSADMTRAAALAFEAWAAARKRSDFSAFLPFLRTNVELKHRYVECFDAADELYDILLDDYERGMTTSEVRAVFDELKRGLVPLIAAAGERDGAAEDPLFGGGFDIGRQEQFGRVVVDRFGFDPDSWRLDPTVHPFATSIGTTDIRITTRYTEDNLHSLFSTMHEFGHGLYEAGVDRALERTLLARGASLGLHESQSRLWENLVGRSRPFWHHFYPRLQKTFPAPLSNVDEDDFYRAVNAIRPSLIRVDADEATYNMHIILRFELEQEIMNGRIPLEDLPEAWNERMATYLAVDVPDDAYGVLQDVHWSFGGFGYFPTYSLGNVISVQIWEEALRSLPDLEESVRRGEFRALREWLRESLHRHGRKFTPGETLERIVGGPIQAGPYLRYLKRKFAHPRPAENELLPASAESERS